MRLLPRLSSSPRLPTQSLPLPYSQKRQRNHKRNNNSKDFSTGTAEDKLYFHNVLKLLRKSAPENMKNKLKLESLSRIYHLIANFKTRNTIEAQYKNQFGVRCWKNNGYKRLSEAELEEVVKLEGVAQKILTLGERINFKSNSIQQEASNMANLLSNTFQQFQSDIDNLKYDLSQREI